MNRLMTRRQAKNVVLAVFAALFLRAVLDYTYVNYVHRYFGGPLTAGAFPLGETNSLRVLESYALVFLLAWWLSSFVVVILFISFPAPGWDCLGSLLCCAHPVLNYAYGMTDAPSSSICTAAGSFVALIAVTRVIPRVKVPRPSHDWSYL